MALAHHLLIIVFHIVGDGTVYQEPGADHLDRKNRHKITRKAAHSSHGAWRLARKGSLQTALSNAVLLRYGFLLPSHLAGK